MKQSFWFTMLVVIIGGTVGLLVGDILLKFFPYLSPYLKIFTASLDLKELNLYFVIIGFRFYLRLNLAALIGIVVILWLFMRSKKR